MLVADLSYQLVVGVGARQDVTVFMGGSIALTGATTGTVFASLDIAETAVAPGDMLDFAIAFDADASLAGENVVVSLCSDETTGSQMLVDHVRFLVGRGGSPPTAEPGIVHIATDASSPSSSTTADPITSTTVTPAPATPPPTTSTTSTTTSTTT